MAEGWQPSTDMAESARLLHKPADAQKSASVVKTCCSPRTSPLATAALRITPARWYSPTRRSKKLVLPLVDVRGGNDVEGAKGSGQLGQQQALAQARTPSLYMPMA